MSEPMRYRTVDYAVGWFILITLAIALIGLVQIGRVQRWFSPGKTLTITLPEQGSLGLRSGSEVVMLGTRVGSVRSVDILPTGKMTASIELRGDFAPFVTTDATVVIKRIFGIAGDAYLEINPGDAEPIAYTGATRLTAHAAPDPQQQITDVLEDMRDTILPTLEKLQKGADSAAQLLATLNDPDGDFRSTLGRIDTLAGRVTDGEGLAAKIFADPKLAADVSTTIAELRAISQDARPIPERLQRVLDDTAAITEDLRKASDQAPALSQELLALTRDLRTSLKQLRPLVERMQRLADSADQSLQMGPQVIMQLDQTLREIERTAAAIRGSWLLGGRTQPQDQDPLRAEEVMP